MPAKAAIVLAAVIMAAISLYDCRSRKQDSEARMSRNGNQVEIAGGITWVAPLDWIRGSGEQMRFRTYVIRAASGDVENAECGVFLFLPGSGGTVGANLERWESQFEQPDGRESSELAGIKELEIHGLKVTTIDLSGIFLASSGQMMERTERKLGYRLLGAIVEAPQGLVFFTMVGPRATVGTATEAFMKMIRSLRPLGV